MSVTVAETATLEEKFSTLQSEISKLSVDRQNLVAEHERQWILYNRELDKYQELQELNEKDKAMELEPKLKKMKDEIESLKERITGSGSLDKIKNAIKNRPESTLHKLATEICRDTAARHLELELEIDKINRKIEKAKETYLKEIEKLGNAQRAIFQNFDMALRIEEVLPVKKHVSKKPRSAPVGASFSIEEKETIDAYGKRPFRISQ